MNTMRRYGRREEEQDREMRQMEEAYVQGMPPMQVQSLPPLPPPPKPKKYRSYFGETPKLCSLTQPCTAIPIIAAPMPQPAPIPITVEPQVQPPVDTRIEERNQPVTSPAPAPTAPPVDRVENPIPHALESTSTAIGLSSVIAPQEEVPEVPPQISDSFPNKTAEEAPEHGSTIVLGASDDAGVEASSKKKDCNLCSLICKVLSDGNEEAKDDCKAKFRAMQEGEISKAELGDMMAGEYGEDWRKKAVEGLKKKAESGE